MTRRLGILLLVGLAWIGRGRIRVAEFHDAPTFWASAVRVTPTKPRPLYQYATALADPVAASVAWGSVVQWTCARPVFAQPFSARLRCVNLSCVPPCTVH